MSTTFTSPSPSMSANNGSQPWNSEVRLETRAAGQGQYERVDVEHVHRAVAVQIRWKHGFGSQATSDATRATGRGAAILRQLFAMSVVEAAGALESSEMPLLPRPPGRRRPE